MLSSMSDQFISEGILSKIVIMKYDSSKCKDYRINLAKNN